MKTTANPERCSVASGSATGAAHPWHNRSGLWKRINGFAVYSFWALVALYDPVMADRVMYRILRDQFSSPNTKVSHDHSANNP